MELRFAAAGMGLLCAACALDFDAGTRRRGDDGGLDDADVRLASGDAAEGDPHEPGEPVLDAGSETLDAEREGDAADEPDAQNAEAGADTDASPGELDSAGPNVDECALGTHDCGASYPCLDTPTGFTCLGRSADWPVPTRAVSGSPESRGFHVEPADGTIYDERTGLAWQGRSSQQLHSSDGARSYCDQLEPAGSWRLPGMSELFSLMPRSPLGGWDDNALPVLANDWLWTGAVTGSTRWDANLLRGMLGPAGPTDQSAALCVRTREVRFDRPLSERFVVDVQANTVLDRATQLVWERTAADRPRSFANAAAYCSALIAPTPYRLPTVAEFISVLDFAGRKVLAPWLGVNSVQSYFWSSDYEVDPAQGEMGYVLVFADHNVLAYTRALVANEFAVRCVRAAP